MASKKKTEKKSSKITVKNSPKRLHDFMMEKMGGEEAVRAEFAASQLKDLPGDMSIQDAFDKASKEGWGAEFQAMPLSAFRLSRVPVKRPKRKNIPAAKVQAAVLAHMKKGKTYKASVVAGGLSFPVDSVRRAMAALVTAKKVKQDGVKRNTVYSLA